MARRKQLDEVESESSEGDLENFAPSAAELGPLAEEVRSFLGRKEELAQKLAHEIETTERKLAELKRTAAALFPEGLGDETPERVERKPKKTKAIKLAAEEPPTADARPPEEGAEPKLEESKSETPRLEAVAEPTTSEPATAEPITSEVPASTGEPEAPQQAA